MGAWSRSWSLFRCSWNILLEDTTLIIFPVLSFVTILAAAAAIFGGATVVLGLDVVGSGPPSRSNLPSTPVALVAIAVAYVATTLSAFFNVALVSCASRRLRGEPAGARYGLGSALYCLPQILAWAAISVTVGLLISAIERRLPLGVGTILIRVVLGFTWGVATFFIIPAIAFGDGSALTAMRESTRAVRARWGELAIGGAGLGLASFVVSIVPTAALVVLGIAGGGMTAYAMAALWYVGSTVTCSTLHQVFITALYEFATTGREPIGFRPGDMQGAFFNE